MVFHNMDYVFFIEISINNTNLRIIYCMLVTLKHGMPSTTTYNVATPALGSRPKQGLARLWAKREARGSHLMLLGVQKNVRE
jgi:hypothetical protein